MIDKDYINRVIADLNHFAAAADHTGNQKIGEAMRRAARLLNAMQAEAELKLLQGVEQWRDNPIP